MMKVTNYAEWKQAITAEHLKLSEVSLYLNEDGTERYRVFATLFDLSCFCDTADELLAWIDSKSGLTRYDATYLESGHASPAISALRRIVDWRALVPMPGTDGSWDERSRWQK